MNGASRSASGREALVEGRVRGRVVRRFQKRDRERRTYQFERSSTKRLERLGAAQRVERLERVGDRGDGARAVATGPSGRARAVDGGAGSASGSQPSRFA